MLKTLINFFFISSLALVTSCYQEQEIPVTIDFAYAVTEGSFTVPVEITLTNNTTGADFYNWTMMGATPSSSNKKQPDAITYSQAGTYIIKLEAWNDTQRSFKEITVQLDSAVTLDFNVDILVNDFAPATAQITNNTRGASSYEWTFQGGTPETSTVADPPNILFSTPGEHVITLKISNGRESYTSSKTVTLKAALDTDFEHIFFIVSADSKCNNCSNYSN